MNKFLILFFVIFSTRVSALTRTSVASGNYNNTAVWNCSCIPATTDDIVIDSGHTVTLVANTTVANLEVKAFGTINSNTQRIDINGNLILNGLITGTNDDVRLRGSGTTINGSGTVTTGGDLIFRDGNKTILSSADISYTGSGQVSIQGITVTNNGQFYSDADINGTTAGSTWINAANAIVTAGDRIMSTGLLSASASGNEVIYSRLGAQNLDNPVSSTYYHLTLKGSGNKNLQANVTISGNLNIEGGNLRTLGSDILLAGNFNNTGGTFQEGTDKITFNGTGIQTISAPVEELFYDFEVNKSAGEVQLNKDINVQNILTLNGRNVVTSSYKVSLGTGSAPGTLVRNSGYIHGYFERYLNATATNYLFPIGNSSTYLPAIVRFSNITAGDLLLHFNEGVPGDNGLPIADSPDTVRHAFTEGYWEMTNSGLVSTNYNVTLTATGFSSYTLNASSRVISRSNSSAQWTANGSHVSASGNDVFRNSLTFLPAQFAIGDTTKCTIPAPSTSAITGLDSVCTGTSAVAYSVLNTSGSTYDWVITGGVQASGSNSNSITVNWSSTGMTGMVKVTESNGCEYGSPVTLDVDIHSLPVDTISGNLTVQENENGVAYSVISRPGYTYNWTITGGNQASGGNTASITVNWLSGGAGIVSVTATSACGTSSAYTLNVDILSFIKSVATGLWSATSTWDCVCVPSSTSNVLIESPNTVTLSGTTTANNVEIESGATLALSTRIFTVTGDFVNNGSCSGTNRLTIAGSGNTISGNGSYSSLSGDLRFNAGVHYIASEVFISKTGVVELLSNSTVINYGSVTATGNFVGNNNTTSVWFNENNSDLEAGLALLTTGTLNASKPGNTVTYNRTGTNNQSIKIPVSNQYYNLVINGTSLTSVKSLQSNVEILGNLELMGSTFDVTTNNYSIELSGDWNNTGGAFTERSGTVNFAGNAQEINHTSTETFFNVTTDNTSDVLMRIPVTITNDLTINAGTTWDVIDTGNYTLSVRGDFQNLGTFQSRQGLVQLNGTTAQIVSGNLLFYNLTLSNAAGATLSSGLFEIQGTLTLSNGTLNTGNNLTLLSNTTGTARIAQITSGAITGNITMQRYIGNPVVYWRMLSSAVSNATISDWNDDFYTTGFTGSDNPSSSFKSIQYYLEDDNGLRDVGYYGVSSTSDTIIPGRGYFVWSIKNSGTGPYTFSVTGPANTGNKNLAVDYTANVGASDDGWSLVGNPYPSTINWDDADWVKTNINNAIYIYDPVGKQYKSYVNGSGTNGGNSLIPSSQGFWVQANGLNPVLTVMEGAKSATDESFLSQTVQNDNIRIKIRGSNNIPDETLIQISELASDTFDSQLDARKIFSTYPGAPGLATYSKNLDYSINTLPRPEADIIIPVKALVKTRGNYSLEINYSNYWGNLSCLVFRDKFLNVSFPLNGDTVYTCFIHDSTKSSRFELTIGEAISADIEAVSCYGKQDGKIVLKGLGNGPWNYTWKNQNDSVIQSTLQSSDADSMMILSAGIYSVQIDSSGLCGKQTGTFSVSEPEQIIAAFNINHDTLYLSQGALLLLENKSQNTGTFFWKFGDGVTSADFEPQHNFASAGSFKVELQAGTTDCHQTTDRNVQVVDDLTTVEENNLPESFFIHSYGDKIFVSGQNKDGEVMNIQFLSAEGKLLDNRSTSARRINEVFTNTGSTKIVLVRITGSDIEYTNRVLVK